MIGFILGERGQGKTKRVINMANSRIKDTEGHVAFIDYDRTHMHSLHSNMKFVEVKDYKLNTYREFIGFIYGMISMDSDIVEIFIDSMSKSLKSLTNDDLIAMTNDLKIFSKTHKVNVVVAISWDSNSVPKEIEALSL